MKNSTFDAHDAMTLLSDQREEKKVAEKFTKFTQFICWLIAPDDTQFISYFECVAAARVISLLQHNVKVQDLCPSASDIERVRDAYFSSESIAIALLRYREVWCSPDDVDTNVFAAETAGDITRFFVQIDQNGTIGTKPSLNRAVRFSEQNGFRTFDEPSARTFVHDCWSKYSFVTPFIAGVAPIDCLALCSPYHPMFFRFFEEMNDKQRFNEWFSYAKFIQNSMEVLYDPKYLDERFTFKFPGFVEPAEFGFGEFTGDQIEKIESYSVLPK